MNISRENSYFNRIVPILFVLFSQKLGYNTIKLILNSFYQSKINLSKLDSKKRVHIWVTIYNSFPLASKIFINFYLCLFSRYFTFK